MIFQETESAEWFLRVLDCRDVPSYPSSQSRAQLPGLDCQDIQPVSHPRSHTCWWLNSSDVITCTFAAASAFIVMTLQNSTYLKDRGNNCG